MAAREPASGRRRLTAVARLLVALVVVAGSLLVAGSSPAGACSCGGGTPAELFERADAVFTGEIVAQRTDASFFERLVGMEGMERRIGVSVDDVYKGTVAKSVVVHTHAQGTACGIEPTVGAMYVLYANLGDGSVPPDPDKADDLQVNTCDGTGPVSADVLAGLPDPSPPRPGGGGLGWQAPLWLPPVTVLALAAAAVFVVVAVRHRRRTT